MDKNFYITTPIYYPSAKPHMGHAYSSIIADFFARFKRIQGFNVYFLTGTDEHGQKIQRAAEKKGMDPLSFCDEISKTFRDLSKTLNLSNNDFIRTTEKRHGESVQNLWNILEKKKAKFALLHCNSTYPAPHDELHLSVIPEMKKRYGCTIGYSGHEYDLEPTILAVALGAKIIERHITLDHEMWGTDQKSSLEVHAMDLLKKRLKDIQRTIGKPEKIITESEKEALKKLRG